MTMEVTTDTSVNPVTDSGHSVTVYGQPGCQPCRATTRTMDKAGVPYHYTDASLDAGVANYLRDTYGPTTPVVEVKDPDTGRVLAAWSGLRVGHIRELAEAELDPSSVDMRG